MAPDRSEPSVRFKRLSSGAILPRYQTEGAAGFDIHAAEDVEIPPAQWRAVETGWAMEIPEGYEVQVRPRSGLAMHHGVTILNAPGTIDSDYRGPVRVILFNNGPAPFPVTAGDRIAQGVLAAVCRGIIGEVDILENSSRGEGGFGSTGR